MELNTAMVLYCVFWVGCVFFLVFFVVLLSFVVLSGTLHLAAFLTEP